MPKGDLKTCLYEADEFYKIAAKCVDENVSVAFGTYRVYPVVVNYSFSCELYIKALIMYRSGDGTPRTHHLKKLMEKHLEPQDCVEVRRRCEARFRTTFESALQLFDTAFVEWRYGFEKELRIDIDDLIEFAKVLNAYAHEVIDVHEECQEN